MNLQMTRGLAAGLIGSILILSACGTPDEPSNAAAQQQVVERGPDSICGAQMDYSYHAYNNIESLAWTSQVVVIGTIVEELPSVWGELIDPTNNQIDRNLYTEFVIRVEQQLRGEPMREGIVREPGGQIGDCIAKLWGENLEVGQRAIFFLEYSNSARESNDSFYFLTGGINQGRWSIEGERARPGIEALTPETPKQGMMLDQALARIDGSLRSGMPPAELHSGLVVPIELSPITPPGWRPHAARTDSHTSALKQSPTELVSPGSRSAVRAIS